MPWVFLVIAGLLEIVWAALMKQSAGFARLGPSLITRAAMPARFVRLAMAMKSLLLGAAFMIWAGMGALGTFAVGMLWLGGAATPLRVLAAAMIAGGAWR